MTIADDFGDWCDVLAANINSLDARISHCVIEHNVLVGQVTDILRLINNPAPPPPTPTPMPPPPPPSTSNPVVGQPYSWTNPATGIVRTFIVAAVVRDQTIANPNTGLLMEIDGAHNRTVYVNCHIEGSRYALWMDHQQDIVFDNCTYEDDFGAPNMSEESTVRIEDSSHIYFKQCNIRGFSQPNQVGAKHVFRVHGACENIVFDTGLWNSEGNGFMAGTYLGGPVSHVNNLVIKDVRLVCGPEGNDCFDPKRDGSLTNFACINVDVRYGSQQWDAPANVRANPYPGWLITNLTSGPNV